MAGHVKGLAGRDLDVGALFEKYTIDEIRDIEKKMRHDIEKKKEDLRQMVGERYRDLIEAADTITEMKRSSDSVTESIARMQDLCNGLKQPLSSSTRYAVHTDGSTAAKHSAGRQQRQMLYCTAVNMKLLMDMPEMIWSALDKGQYLHATALYQLAQHVYTSVRLDIHAAHAISRFPLLARHATSIAHFRSTILQNCRNRLEQTSVTDEAVSECLCSLLLLEDLTTEQLFAEFLSVRLEAMRELFSTDSLETSIRLQVCNVFCLLVTTIHQIYAVFYAGEGDTNQPVLCNLLATMLKRVTSKSPEGNILSNDDVSLPSQQHLSKSIVEFRPTPRHPPVPISLKTLTERSQSFLQQCTKIINEGLVKILGFVTSVKALTDIRDELWNLLKQDSQLVTWDVVCAQILGRQLHVWSSFASAVFVGRVEELLENEFDGMLSTSQTQISKVLAELSSVDDRAVHYERDMSHYIWLETALDIPSSEAKSAADHTLAGGTLIMKARGYTPAVQSLCRGVDQKLKLLLDDANHYIQPQTSVTDTGDGPFDRFADKKQITDFLQSECEKCVTKQLEYLKSQLEECRIQLSQSTGWDKSGIIHRLILMGRFASALSELSQHLQTCMCPQSAVDQSATTASRLPAKKMVAMRLASKSDDNPQWTRLRDQLLSFSHNAYNLWTDHVSKLLLDEFETALNDHSPKTLLNSTTQWDCIEIEEETDDNRIVKSNIRVPMQASWHVQTMLYSLCMHINRVGGQTIPVSSMRGMIEQLMSGVLSAYDRLLTGDSRSDVTAINQVRALQLVFDLKFLANVLVSGRDDSEASKAVERQLRQVTDKLESHIDPFDLDVFSPHIHNHLARQTQRSNVLYGLLVACGKPTAVYAGSSSTTSHQEQHNVLPLSTSQTRFQLLPLSTQSRLNTGASLQPPMIVQPHKSKLPTTITGSSAIDAAPLSTSTGSVPPRAASASFLEHMSTMWFSK